MPTSLSRCTTRALIWPQLLLLPFVLMGIPLTAQAEDYTGEEAAIVETLTLETRYFCERNLEAWAEQWRQEPTTEKLYSGDTPFRHFKGFEEIRKFAADHMTAKPAPLPIPEYKGRYEITLFPRTAMVFYTQQRTKGPVTTFCLMVKDGEKWKIARMSTVY